MVHRYDGVLRRNFRNVEDVGCVELRYVHYFLLSVDSSTSLEILRCTQDDILCVRLPRLVPSLAMTVYGISLAMTVDSV